MYFPKTVLIILFSLNMNAIYSQNLESHKWESRLLLVLTDDTNNTIYKRQIATLKRHKKELEERKLIVYQIKKDSFRKGLRENSEWKNSSQLYSTYKKSNNDFEILLIGLDGGFKIRQTDLITCEDLFSIIDVMPMRRSEINNKN